MMRIGRPHCTQSGQALRLEQYALLVSTGKAPPERRMLAAEAQRPVQSSQHAQEGPEDDVWSHQSL